MQNRIGGENDLLDKLLSEGGGIDHEGAAKRVVTGNDAVNVRLKGAERRTLLKKCKVRFASAVRGAEPPQRHRGAHRLEKDAGPLVLAPYRVVAIPDVADPKNRPEVIDVPMAPCAATDVPRDPGANAAGPERAADVYVKPGSDRQNAQRAHPKLGRAGRAAHEGVSPRTGPDRLHGRPHSICRTLIALPLTASTSVKPSA